MGNPRGFIQIRRSKHSYRPVGERLANWSEFEIPFNEGELREQASRCMDCGIPFCNKGCPLGNLIPDWNDHVYRGRWDDAVEAIEATNNFPEVTGRVCPAPCEASCVLNIEESPVAIKSIEQALGAKVLSSALEPKIAAKKTGRTVAVIGSGPAGMAAAQQLARAGHDVTLFERSDRIGGLLRYGIPDFKLEKHLIDRRIEQMAQEGVVFRTNVNVGVDITGAELRAKYDAVVLCVGASQPRDLPVPGRELKGIYFAMDYLTQQNKRTAGDPESLLGEPILATGKRVVILGGGDTGSDCLGTSLRQGAASALQVELMPAPPPQRSSTNPWPEWPMIMRTSSSQEEGGDRDFAVLTKAFTGENGVLTGIEATRVELQYGSIREKPGTKFVIPCDMVLLAMGFTGTEKLPLFDQLGVKADNRNNLIHSEGKTSVEGVFVAGDAGRGSSLVVWAIREGRDVAVQVDKFLRSLPELITSVPEIPEPRPSTMTPMPLSVR